MLEGKLIDHYAHNQERDMPQVLLLFVLLIIAIIGYLALGPKLLFSSMELVLLFAIMFPFSLWLMVSSSYRLWLKPTLYIFDNGLRYSDKRRSQFWRWEDFSDIRALRPFFSQTGRYGLYIDGRRVLLLDDRFQRSVIIGNRMIAELYQRRDYETQLQQSGKLRLGKLDITPDGVQLSGKRLIPWTAIRAVNQHNHMTQCQISHSLGRPVKLRTRNLPDAPLLVQFLGITWNQRIHASHPETSPALGDSKPQAMIEARFLWHKSVFQIVLALIGIGATLYVIVPGVANALEYDLIDWGWLRDSFLVLIIPIISLTVLFRESRQLFENPRLVADETGLHRYARSGESHWTWNAFSDIKLVKLFGWFPTVRIGYEIAIDDQPILAIDNRYAQVGDLGKMAQEMHTAAYYQEFKKQMEKGKTLTFGVIALDQVGIQFAGKNYGWNAIKSFDIQNLGNETHLIVYDHNDKRLLAVTIFRISNTQILTQILHEHLTGETVNGAGSRYMQK